MKQEQEHSSVKYEQTELQNSNIRREVPLETFCWLIILSHLSGMLIIMAFYQLSPLKLIILLDEEVFIRSRCQIIIPPELNISPESPDYAPMDISINTEFRSYVDQQMEYRMEGVPLFFMQNFLEIRSAPERICDEFSNVDLVIAVTSSCESVDRRNDIRYTWGTQAYELGVPVVFFVGTKDDGECPIASKEASEYDDVILGNFVDSDSNQTLKHVLILKWVEQECNNKFLLLTKDEILANVPAILNYIKRSRKRLARTITGAVNESRDVGNAMIRKNNTSLSNLVLPYNNISKYIQGPGYLISGDILRDLYFSSLTTPYLASTDLFITGIISHKLSIRLRNEPRFDFSYSNVDFCSFRRLFLKFENSTTFTKVWENIHIPKEC